MISDKKPPFIFPYYLSVIFVELCNSQKTFKMKGSTMPNSEAIGATSIHELVNF